MREFINKNKFKIKRDFGIDIKVKGENVKNVKYIF